MNRFHYCYGDEEWFSLLLWRQGMVFTTAMETGMVYTTAMETKNGLHYCYGHKEWLSLLLWRKGMVLRYNIVYIVFFGLFETLMELL